MVVDCEGTNGRGHLGSSEPGPHFGGADVEGLTYGVVVNGLTVVVDGSKGLGHLASVEPGKHFGGDCVNGGKYVGPVVLVPVCGQRGSFEPG